MSIPDCDNCIYKETSAYNWPCRICLPTGDMFVSKVATESKSECKRVNILKGKPMMEGIDDAPTPDSERTVVDKTIGHRNPPIKEILGVPVKQLQDDELDDALFDWGCNLSKWSNGNGDYPKRAKVVEAVIKIVMEHPDLKIWSSELFWSATPEAVLAILQGKKV